MQKFNAQKTCDDIVQFIRDYYTKNNIKGAVLGISGGKDSGVVAALMCKAIGAENVVGLTLPCHSAQEDRELAKSVSDYYGFKLYNCNLTEVFNEFKSSILSGFKQVEEEKLINSDINLKPRLRMSTVYYYAAMLSQVMGGTYLVIGTSNKCEMYVGYFTKGGDNVNDLNPIADLTVEEVIAVGEVLKVPKEVLYKTPSDGLSGKSDEEKLGVSYKDIALYMQNKNSVSKEVASRIEKLHRNNAHKFKNNYFVKVNYESRN